MKSINAKYLINEACYQKYFCFRNFAETKNNFVPKGILIGFKMAKKKVYKQTKNRHFHIYMSRDDWHCILAKKFSDCSGI